MAGRSDSTCIGEEMNVCQFCMRRSINHQTEEGYLLCDRCHSSLEEVKSNLGKSPLEITPKDPSTLCIRCGLCCVMLAAKVEEEEVQPFLDTARIEGLGNYEYEDFAYTVKGGPFKGETLINMPCKFLKGRILHYVNCAAYSIDRPKVCGGYLCKIAIKYKIGLISLEEAAFALRSAFDLGDLSIFNWTHDDVEEEERLQLFSEVARASQFLRDQGRSQEEIDLIVLSRMTPSYIVKSAQHQALFRMHLYRVDRDDFDPLLFFTPEEIASWQPAAAEFAELIIRRVMEVMRSYFINVESAALAQEAIKQREKEDDEDGDQEGREEVDEEGERRGTDEDDGPGGQGGDGQGGQDLGEDGERDAPSHPSDQPDEHPQVGTERGTASAGGEAGEGRADHLTELYDGQKREGFMHRYPCSILICNEPACVHLDGKFYCDEHGTEIIVGGKPSGFHYEPKHPVKQLNVDLRSVDETSAKAEGVEVDDE